VAASVFISSATKTAVVNSLDGLRALESEWRELWRRDRSATPFHSPDWLIPWTRYLWGGGKLQVVTLRRGGRLAAVTPFFVWGYGRGELRLSLLGCGISDYLGMISVPGFADEAAGAVARWMTQPEVEWNSCDLQELRPGDPLLAAAQRFTGLEPWQCSVCPVMSLRGSLKEQLAETAAKFRRSIRTAEKRLHEAGDVEFVRATAEDVDWVIDALFDLHTARWQECGESGMFARPSLRKFHREVAHRFARNDMLRLYGLLVNGQCVAVQYNFAANRRVYAYLAGFDPAWNRSSPGAVLLAHSIEDAIAEGDREFDFLRQAEEFKYSWGAVDQRTEQLLIRTQAGSRIAS
jgi:CelD/BcsL family acetyltransferase involved in cellulose biosynthesis